MLRCLPLLGLLAPTLLPACGDDDAGTATDGPDDTTGNTDATVDTDTGEVVTTSIPNSYTSGGAETCVLLFGGNDRVRADDDDLPLENSARTIQAWVRTRSLAEQTAFSYGRPSPNQGFMIGAVDGYPLVRAGSGSERIVGDVFLADDTWHHLAASYDGTLAVLTLDGRSVGVGPLTVETLEGDLVAGNTPTGDLTTPWLGWLDDAIVFDTIRTPIDIAADLDGESMPDENRLVHWDFEIAPDSTGPGLLVPDGTGNGHDGTTGGAEGTPLFLPCR